MCTYYAELTHSSLTTIYSYNNVCFQCTTCGVHYMSVTFRPVCIQFGGFTHAVLVYIKSSFQDYISQKRSVDQQSHEYMQLAIYSLPMLCSSCHVYISLLAVMQACRANVHYISTEILLT